MADKDTQNEANIRRATSDLYYSLFHAICHALVEPLIGDPEDDAYVGHYRAFYRQADHKLVERRCREFAQNKGYSAELRNFAKAVITQKNKRSLADYDPLERFSISVIKNDIETCETRLKEFWSVSIARRAEFARYVALARYRFGD
ncbi:hypothetical protein [uncultured Roseobacter sp.]|uniref:hypothetical protein n=1 Tax=uncultured Roseobacter sp. TaxID=114847 RepID=UPI002620933A|nr:hypothetical protein [uncultured Roseobacter sp.]